MKLESADRATFNAWVKSWEWILDPDEVPETDRFLSAFEIEGVQGPYVNFELNLVQQKIEEVIRELDEAGKPVRILVLKARQMGVSTYSDGRIFSKVVRIPGQKCLIMADNDDNTQELYASKVVELWGQIPKAARPEQIRSNRRELTIRHGNSRADKRKPPHLRKRGRSYVRVLTAGTKRGGASRTIQHLHGSEVAFWENDKDALDATLQCVHDVPGTSVILESTANGASGAFYEMWMDAVSGKSDYIPLFFPWFIFPAYSREFDSEEERVAFIDSMDETEKAIQELHSLTLEQMYWRRYTLHNKCRGDLLRFQVEYPATPEEAFIATGTCRFDKAALLALEQTAPKPMSEGSIVHMGGAWRYIPAPGGHVTLFRKPVPGRDYAIAADTAEGVEGGDYSAACVYERRSRRLMAEIHGRMDTREYSRLLYGLGHWYNQALMTVETNSIGLEVAHRLEDLRYPRLYIDRPPERLTRRQRDRIGFYMTKSARDFAITALASEIANGTIELSKPQINECRSFVTEDGKKWEARAGYHDDRVMAAAIFCAINRREKYEDAPPPDPMEAHKTQQQRRVEAWENKLFQQVGVEGHGFDPTLGTEW